MGDEYDSTMTELAQETSRRLLGASPVGSVVFVDGDEVGMLPVNAAVQLRAPCWDGHDARVH